MRYDLIQISPFGTATPPSAGGQALDAQYLYTVEGMRLALSRLTARGILAVTLTLDLPPRSAVKMLDTIAEALRSGGNHGPPPSTWPSSAPGIQSPSPPPLAALPGQQTAVRAFCRSRAFDLVWLPNIAAAEVNRYNILERPFIYEAAREIWQGGKYRQVTCLQHRPGDR